MKKVLVLGSALLVFAMLVMQCKLDDSINTQGFKPALPDQVADYANFKSPSGEQGGIVDPCFGCPNFGFGFNQQNPAVTNHGATLGRVLFYDTKLSINNAVSCASCHKQNLAFADDVAGSEGFGGKTTPRNSMAIVNAGFNNNLFWDSRAANLQELASLPIQNHLEMGMESMEQLTRKLEQVDYYADLFEKAYGSRSVSPDRISSAIAQFVASMVSSNSKWDQGVATDHSNFTPLEKMGKDIFFSQQAKCSQCHAGPNFSAPDFAGGEYGEPTVRGTANVGLDLKYKDNGLGEGQFRIPSLRNIALTGPYMHDGRFTKLEEVVEHYDRNIKPHTNLDDRLMSGSAPQKLNLTQLDKEALVAFLGTLSDNSLTSDQKFATPFK